MSDEKLDYHQYIASFQWKRKSEEALKRAAYVCENCGKEEEEISLNTLMWSNLNGHFAKPNKYDSEVSHEPKTNQTTLH